MWQSQVGVVVVGESVVVVVGESGPMLKLLNRQDLVVLVAGNCYIQTVLERAF